MKMSMESPEVVFLFLSNVGAARQTGFKKEIGAFLLERKGKGLRGEAHYPFVLASFSFFKLLAL